ncbi:MAG: hypothetical protein ABIQ72_11910 [Usitatibacter sp.]
MKAYEFSALPSSSAVASGVTILAAAWFVLAGGAILSDHHSGATLEAARASSAPVSTVYYIPAEARETIVVEAKRSAS